MHWLRGRLWLCFVFRPRRALRQALREGAGGLEAVAVAGGAWALLCAALASAGHTPSGPSPFGAYHYGVQAVVVVPLTLFLWRLVTWAGNWAAGLSPTPEARSTRDPVGVAYGGAILWALVVPELVCFIAMGVEGLRRVTPWAMLALAVISLLGVAQALVFAGSRWPRALLAALLALSLQGAIGGVFLR